jgi:hypothetical protein
MCYNVLRSPILLCLVEVQRMMQEKLVVSESASITYKVVV